MEASVRWTEDALSAGKTILLGLPQQSQSSVEGGRGNFLHPDEGTFIHYTVSRTIEGALLNMSADKPVSVACKRCFYFSIGVMFKRVIFSQKNYKID